MAAAIEWIRFGASAAFALLGVIAFICAGVGVCRFDYVLLRLHAAALADTVGIASMAISAAIYFGVDAVSLKEICASALMVLTSPVSTHLLTEIEYKMGSEMRVHTRLARHAGEDAGEDGGESSGGDET